MTDIQELVLAKILRERRMQDIRFGLQKYSPIEWMGLITEELAEAAKAANESHFEHYTKDMSEWEAETFKARKIKEFKAEIIQVAAMCFQALESME